MRPVFLIAALLLLSTPAPAPAADLDALLAALRQPPPLSQPFQEVRFRRALKAPLVTSGTLAWLGGLEFERRIETPYRETGVVSGRTLVVRRDRGAERIIPLARAPELQVLFGGLSALFGGDVQALREAFEIELEGGETWRLLLRPRQPELQARVAQLELRGSGGEARCLVLQQEGADTLTVFTDQPLDLAAGDFAAVVDGQCPQP